MEDKVKENNLRIYNLIKEVPDEAQKKITGGRLNGMTDIKPMWRIEKLTEIFGMCGFGWKTTIKNKEIIEGANGEKIAIVDIDLFVKDENGNWSDAIEGTGGSSFIANESKGLYTSDECFKMAYTDALSVACKSLGMGANVYWGDSKYNTTKIATKEEAEKYKLSFGKHKDKTLIEINKEAPDYIEWLVKNSNDDAVLTCIELLFGMKKNDFEVDEETILLTAQITQLVSETSADLEKIKTKYNLKDLKEATKDQLKEIKEILTKKKEILKKISEKEGK